VLVEYVRYTIQPEHTAEFEAAYARAIASLEASSHCLGYELSRCQEEPSAYVLRLEWDSLVGHLQGFRKSSEFAAFFHEIKPYIDCIAEMRHYEIVLQSNTAKKA
jgi:quinol monooxygenase YgiN